MKMVRQCEHSLSFSKAVLVLTCLCALSSPNYVHPVTESDNQDGSGEDYTALDLGKQTVRNLKQLVGTTLDERTLEAFPIERDGRIERINIAKRIGISHSAEFGGQLLEMENVNMVNEIIKENPKTANIQILWQWLNGKGKKPVTFRTLIDVLHDIDLTELANQMVNTCKILKIIDVHYKPVLVKEYSQRLSKKYEQDAVIDSEQWLLKRLHGRNVTFVDLELKEDDSNILLYNVLSDMRDGTRILFLGRPGVGKSTITRHLSRTLIHTEHFYLVVRLHLSGSGKINNLHTLLQAVANESFPDKPFDSRKMNVISHYIEKTLGEGVCFLLDGYDEYIKPPDGYDYLIQPQTSRPDGYDYVISLIKSETLHKSVVIVTSRPSAAENIESYFERKVEIIGFGERGIQKYLEQLKLSQNESDTIHQYLDTHPDVRRLCYLPLHLSMLVYITVSPIHTGTLSPVDTETKLYTEFLFLTIKQYEFVRHRQTVESLRECFNNLSTETDLCVLFRKISEKAFEGILSREQTFISSSLNELPYSMNVSAEIEALSLFKIETIYDGYGDKLEKYYYSHPTFQDFLAAFHLATLQREDQLSHIKLYWTHGMYKFFFGLIGSQLRYDDETVFQTFVSFGREILATCWHEELYIMKCAHEIGRSSQYVAYLQAAGVMTYSNSLNVPSHPPHDCWYIGYTLSQSPLYELAVDKLSGARELALCLSFIKYYFKHDPQTSGSGSVIKLNLGQYSTDYWQLPHGEGDSMTTREILEFLPAFLDDLTDLELKFSMFEHSSSVSHLREILKPFRNLQFLELSVNISVVKERHLESALRDLTHLEHLKLSITNEGSDDTTVPEDLLKFYKSVKQLQSLTLFIVWNNDQVDVNVSVLIGGLEYLTELESLSIHIILNSGFKDKDATELLQGVEKISGVNSLTLHLDLCLEHGLGNVTTKELAVALKNLTMLKNLSLCIDFNLSGIKGTGGVTELAEGLKELTELQALRLELRWELRTNDNVDEAAIALVDGLKHLRNLHVLELDLRQNGSCSEIAPLFKFLAQLNGLKLRCKKLGEKTDTEKLFNGLKHLKQLRKLDLSWNHIGDDDVKALVEALKQMPHLHTLDLTFNKLGDDGVKLLAEMIENQHLTKLQVLLLNLNNFSEVGAKMLASKAEKLSQLHTLKFSFELGAYSARALALIHQQNEAISNPVLSSDISDEKWHVLYFVITLVVSALVGGVLCYRAFNSDRLLSSETSSYKAFESKEISEALAQSIFSTSYAWKLERLRKRNLDGTGTVIVILDTAVDCNCLAFGQKNILYVDCPTAVEFFHPAFLQRNIPVVNCLPYMPVTSTEHGNVCAAVAVGSSYNTPSGDVPSGVAPGAQLIVYRIAEGGYSYNEAVLRALDDLKVKIESGTQIDVVSISYDLNEDNEEEIHRKIKELTERCVVFVAAAGNRGEYQPHASIPARFDNVISVGACDRNGRRSKFNVCGRIDVYAPGEDIPLPSTQDTFRGTSFATPAVCGLVLLLKQCTNQVGPPANNHIHQVEILRDIFQRHMITKSDDGQVDVFDPVGFFLHVIDNPNLLNEIVQEHLDFQHMEQ